MITSQSVSKINIRHKEAMIKYLKDCLKNKTKKKGKRKWKQNGKDRIQKLIFYNLKLKIESMDFMNILVLTFLPERVPLYRM